MPIYNRNTVQGTALTLEHGVINKEVEAYFCNGQCHALAYILHKRLDLPFVLLEHALYKEIIHCAVLLPDGDYLDIKGVHNPEGSYLKVLPCNDPMGFLESCTEGNLWDDQAWMEPDLYLAQRYATLVIDKYYGDIAISMNI